MLSFEKIEIVQPRTPEISEWRQPGTWGLYQGRWFRLCTNSEKVPAAFPIVPMMLGEKFEHCVCAFLNRDGLETLAVLLVRFAQLRGNWGDFTQKEFTESKACNGNVWPAGWLNDLGFILENADGSFSFTQGFVLDCLAATQRR